MVDIDEGRRLLDAYLDTGSPSAANAFEYAWHIWVGTNAEALLTFAERAQAVLTECYRYFDATADSDMAEKLAEVLNSLTTTAPVDEVRQ